MVCRFVIHRSTELASQVACDYDETVHDQGWYASKEERSKHLPGEVTGPTFKARTMVSQLIGRSRYQDQPETVVHNQRF